MASEIFNCELSKITDAFFTARPRQLKQKEASGKSKWQIDSHRSEEDDEAVQISKDKYSSVNQEENDDEFEKLFVGGGANEEEDDNGVEGTQTLRKSFGETYKPQGRSTRYEVQQDEDDEEVDLEEINLRADETIEDALVHDHSQTPTFLAEALAEPEQKTAQAEGSWVEG